jgi:hypothetical protein
MIEVLAEVVTDDREARALERDTLTAVVLGVWRHSDGRHGACLNAYVDGRGHRTLHVELTPTGYAQALASLRSPGTLVRSAGMVVGEGPCAVLLAAEGLELLRPHVPD